MNPPGVFCTDPKCRKRLGDRVAGLYETTCPRCGKQVVVVMAEPGVFRTADGIFHVTVERIGR